MAEELKIFGQAAPAANTWTKLVDSIATGKQAVVTVNTHNFSKGSGSELTDEAWVRTIDGADAGVQDTFTRADSASTMGTTEVGSKTWTAGAGTWGISSNKAYSVTDANSDKATLDSGLADAHLRCTVRGTFNHATNYRMSVLTFRYIDANNFLMVDLYNGNVRLGKVDVGVTSNLASVAQTTADDTDYAVRVEYVGTSVLVYVNEVLKITHTLAGGDATKYLTQTVAGFLLSKGGSPATAARWDDFAVQAAITDKQKGPYGVGIDVAESANLVLGKAIGAASQIWVKSTNGKLAFESYGSLVTPDP